jgi:uncharacterized protein YjbI with pentapeptide repeats
MSPAPASPSARRRIDQAELDAICARHDRLWQAKPGGARAVFAWMDLSGLSLAGRNLADADFAAAWMHETNLTGARLDNATFFGADMQDCILVDASMRRADLRGASLRGADLSGADLFEADLREGTIAAADSKLGFRVVEAKARQDTQAQGACLVGANLQRSKLTGVVAVAADFTDAIMKDCKLVRANLKQASFRGADLAGADLSGADLSGADMRDAVLVGVKMAMWRTDGANMAGALTDDRSSGAPIGKMPAADMLAEHAKWCETGGVQGQPSVFDGVDLRGPALHQRLQSHRPVGQGGGLLRARHGGCAASGRPSRGGRPALGQPQGRGPARRAAGPARG